MNNELIPFGVVTKPFGIQGALKLKLFNVHSENLRTSLKLFFKSNKISKNFSVKQVLHKDCIFLHEITTRTEAERWIGAEVFIERAALLPLDDENEFYYADLMGARIENINGASIGILIGLSSNGAQDLFEIQTSSGAPFSLPNVKEFVKHIDVQKKIIVIDPPLGLIE